MTEIIQLELLAHSDNVHVRTVVAQALAVVSQREGIDSDDFADILARLAHSTELDHSSVTVQQRADCSTALLSLAGVI